VLLARAESSPVDGLPLERRSLILIALALACRSALGGEKQATRTTSLYAEMVWYLWNRCTTKKRSRTKNFEGSWGGSWRSRWGGISREPTEPSGPSGDQCVVDKKLCDFAKVGSVFEAASQVLGERPGVLSRKWGSWKR